MFITYKRTINLVELQCSYLNNDSRSTSLWATIRLEQTDKEDRFWSIHIRHNRHPLGSKSTTTTTAATAATATAVKAIAKISGEYTMQQCVSEVFGTDWTASKGKFVHCALLQCNPLLWAALSLDIPRGKHFDRAYSGD